MAYFNTCPNCGSNLDPGEKCDCLDERTERRTATYASVRGYQMTRKSKSMEHQYAETESVGIAV